MTLEEQLIRDEGLVLSPYRDVLGHLTIGVGHNLDVKPISNAAAMQILKDNIKDTSDDLKAHIPWTDTLDEVRRACLLNMCFNLGIGGLMRFTRTLYLVKKGNYSGAAREMLRSKWAIQVGPRAIRLSKQMETGVIQ